MGTWEKFTMPAPNLRIFSGPKEDNAVVDRMAKKPAGETVRVPLSEIIPLLADAVRSGRTWLRDFEDDEITISMDLYEVILAYQYYRCPSA